MGNHASTDQHRERTPSCYKPVDFNPLDLRGPIFTRTKSRKFDLKANAKYCSEEIIKNWFKIVDLDSSGEITFEEYRQSFLAKGMTEEEARENFKKMDLNQNQLVDYDEFRQFVQSAATPEVQQ